MVFILCIFLSSEIQSGLIGVGLINVEDRSGGLSLDKGENFRAAIVKIYIV